MREKGERRVGGERKVEIKRDEINGRQKERNVEEREKKGER